MRNSILLVLIASGAAFAADAQFNGRWDINVPRDARPHGWWLEVSGAGTPNLKGRFVGFPGGDMNDIPHLAIQKGELHFDFDWKDYRSGKPMHRDYSARVTPNGKLLGLVRSSDGEAQKWVGVRAPVINEKDDGSWRDGNPIEIFNGKDLAGWHGAVPGSDSGWKADDGVLKNGPHANDLASDQNFWNFKLHIEYRVDPHSNSGIGLRGRYEVQILDDFGQNPTLHSNGALYSRIVPAVNASKPAGEWQSFDIRLVGRYVTVVLNDKKIIDKQEIEGLTAIANNADEAKPGPILLQGDHGPVEFRKVTLTPLMR